MIAALQEAIEKGTSFGAPCALENTLAEMVIDAVPSVEMVRFVNSGTEACMAVLRLILPTPAATRSSSSRAATTATRTCSW